MAARVMRAMGVARRQSACARGADEVAAQGFQHGGPRDACDGGQREKPE